MGFKTVVYVDGSPPQRDASAMNDITSELNNIVTSTGEVLNDGVTDQIAKGISTYSTGGDFFIDSGAANAYVVSPNFTLKTPVSYFNGMRIRFVPTNSNTTGASTVNVASLGVKNIKKIDGSTDPVANFLQTGIPISLFYDGTSFIPLEESFEKLFNLNDFSGLPLTSASTSIPGPTFTMESLSGDNKEGRERVNQTLGASVSNQVILNITSVGASPRYMITGTCFALEFLTANHDMASWDINCIGNFSGGTDTNSSIINRALISQNHNLHSEITIVLFKVSQFNHQLRVSYSGGSDIQNFQADLKILRIR